jgi:hypothetical protein
MNDRPNGSACWPDHRDCLHRSYIGRACTLHGEPAKIVKDVDGHASVAPLDSSRGSVPYSWTAVYNIMDNRNGKFGD